MLQYLTSRRGSAGFKMGREGWGSAVFKQEDGCGVGGLISRQWVSGLSVFEGGRGGHLL